MLKHHLIRRTLAGGLVVAAGTVPAAAQARHATGDTFSSSSSYPAPIVISSPAAQPGASFQWGDAGVGAGAALLLSAGVAGAAMTRRRRVHPPAVS